MAEDRIGDGTLPVADVEGLLAQARLAAGGDPAASAWVDGVLARHLLKTASVPAGRKEWLGTSDPYDLVVGCVGMLAAEGLTSVRALSRSVADTMERLGVSLETSRRTKAKALLATRFGPAVRASPVARTWRMLGPNALEAVVRIGPLALDMRFHGLGDGVWNLAWGLAHETPEEIRARPAGTGTFPAVDRAVKQVTREFMEIVGAGGVEIHGADAKRNAHNSSTWEEEAPYGWRMERIVDHGSPRADAEGTVGIVLVSESFLVPRSKKDVARVVTAMGKTEILPSYDEHLRLVGPVQTELFSFSP